MIGGAVMTSLMLALSGDLFEPPAKTIVDNLPICAVVRFWLPRHRICVPVVLVRRFARAFVCATIRSSGRMGAQGHPCSELSFLGLFTSGRCLGALATAG